jgi:hypothetical protein
VEFLSNFEKFVEYMFRKLGKKDDYYDETCNENENEIDYNFNDEYQYRGGKDFAVLYQMQQNNLRQLDETEEIENYPKHHFKRKKRVFPRKKQIYFDIKCDENFSKDTFIVSMKKELDDILERCL